MKHAFASGLPPNHCDWWPECTLHFSSAGLKMRRIAFGSFSAHEVSANSVRNTNGNFFGFLGVAAGVVTAVTSLGNLPRTEFQNKDESETSFSPFDRQPVKVSSRLAES